MNKVKKTVFVILMLSFLVVGWGAVASAAVEVEGDAYIGVYSKYLSKGFDYSDGKAVLQGGMDLSAYGFTLGVWSNMQLKSTDDYDSRVNETDFNIDYTFALCEGASMSLGNMHYTYNFPGEDNDSENEAYVALALDVPFSPELTVTYGWDVDNDGLTGLFYKLGGSHELELSEAAALTLGVLVTYNQESYFAGDYNEFHNYELTASLDYALTDNWGLTAGVLYSDALSNEAEDEGVDSEFVGSLNLAFSF